MRVCAEYDCKARLWRRLRRSKRRIRSSPINCMIPHRDSATSANILVIALAFITAVAMGPLMFFLGGSIALRSAPESAIVTLHGEAERLGEEVAKIRRERDTLNDTYAALNAEYNALLNKTAANRSKRESPEDRALVNEQRAENLERQVTELTAERDRLDSQIAELKAATNQVAAQLVSVTRERDDLKTQILNVTQKQDRVASQPGRENQPDAGGGFRSQSTSSNLLTEELKRGLEVYNAGRYDLAFQTWLPLARQGIGRAQFYIGGLYLEGRGVKGNRVQSYYWLVRSDQAGYSNARKLLETVEQQMTPSELAAAHELIEPVE